MDTLVSVLLFHDFSNQILCTFLDLTRAPDTRTSFDLSPWEHQMNMELVIMDVFLSGPCICYLLPKIYQCGWCFIV